MKYNVRVKKRARNVKVYTIVKKTGSQENALTRLFMKVFAKGNKRAQADQ
jgi:hypothetical protein